MRRIVMILPLAMLAVTSASAATFVLDDFDTPTPQIAIDSPSGTIASRLDLQGPHARSMLAYSFVDGPVSYRIGNGAFVRRPATGSIGDTLIYYGVFGATPDATALDLSSYHFLRLDFNYVTGGDPLNLVMEFANLTPTPAKPIYYGLAGINWVYTPQHRSALIPLDATAVSFDFSHVQGMRMLFDQSGSGVDGFSLDRIAFTTGVPEPTNWALMLGGFGLIGTAVRRRGRVVLAC